ncbi:hypothetical protein [Marinomonas epiphytica]
MKWLRQRVYVGLTLSCSVVYATQDINTGPSQLSHERTVLLSCTALANLLEQRQDYSILYDLALERESNKAALNSELLAQQAFWKNEVAGLTESQRRTVYSVNYSRSCLSILYSQNVVLPN